MPSMISAVSVERGTTVAIPRLPRLLNISVCSAICVVMYISLVCSYGSVCCHSSGRQRNAITHAQSDWLKLLKTVSLQGKLVTGWPSSGRRPAASSKISTPLVTTLPDKDRRSSVATAGTIAGANPQADCPLVRFHRDR